MSYQRGKQPVAFLKIRNKTRISPFAHLDTGSPRQGSDSSGIQTGEEVAKLPSLADNMVLYVETPKTAPTNREN